MRETGSTEPLETKTGDFGFLENHQSEASQQTNTE